MIQALEKLEAKVLKDVEPVYPDCSEYAKIFEMNTDTIGYRIGGCLMELKGE